ncbi:MAG: DNA topoisomerase, partial [Candidatus Methanomethylicia archaeon]
YGVIEEDDKLIPIYDTIRRCRKCNRNVTETGEICNICKSKLENKRKIIEALKKVAKEVDVLIIATDDDSEGEKIGWDIAQILSPYVKEIKRIRFHEVTTRALREALQKLGEIDARMVEAQLVRRIEDRWIGFELSKKVQEEFGKKDLSAGRVQTPVLGWIVESIQELKRNVVDVLEVTLQNDRKILMTTEKMRRRELEKIIKDIESSEVDVLDVNIKEEELKPKPPYTTDALLRDSSERLGLSASETMRVAQDLFEWGLITYHRTSSTRVSALGMKIAADYISEKWGPGEYAPR